jgi:hypothetical protein
LQALRGTAKRSAMTLNVWTLPALRVRKRGIANEPPLELSLPGQPLSGVVTHRPRQDWPRRQPRRRHKAKAETIRRRFGQSEEWRASDGRDQPWRPAAPPGELLLRLAMSLTRRDRAGGSRRGRVAARIGYHRCSSAKSFASRDRSVWAQAHDLPLQDQRRRLVPVIWEPLQDPFRQTTCSCGDRGVKRQVERFKESDDIPDG